MVKSLEQIHAEFRQQKKHRQQNFKIVSVDATFTPLEVTAEPEQFSTEPDAGAIGVNLMEETASEEQLSEVTQASADGAEIDWMPFLVAEQEFATEVEAEPMPEEAVFQELDLFLLYGNDELSDELEFIEGAAIEIEPQMEREAYLPRSLADIEHEFKETMGRGRRENAPKTVHHRRIASGISSFIYYTLTLLLVLTAWIYAQNGRLFLGNYKMHSVLSGSMESVYPQGSLFFTKVVDLNELVIGNDIAFYRDATTTVVHRITYIYESSNDSAQRIFITKGVNNDREDDAPVLAENVVGKVVFFIPHIGNLFKNINNRFHIIVIFFVSGVLFSFFLNMTIGETSKERKIRKAKAVLKKDVESLI